MEIPKHAETSRPSGSPRRVSLGAFGVRLRPVDSATRQRQERVPPGPRLGLPTVWAPQARPAPPVGGTEWAGWRRGPLALRLLSCASGRDQGSEKWALDGEAARGPAAADKPLGMSAEPPGGRGNETLWGLEVGGSLGHGGSRRSSPSSPVQTGAGLWGSPDMAAVGGPRGIGLCPGSHTTFRELRKPPWWLTAVPGQ